MLHNTTATLDEWMKPNLPIPELAYPYYLYVAEGASNYSRRMDVAILANEDY